MHTLFAQCRIFCFELVSLFPEYTCRLNVEFFVNLIYSSGHNVEPFLFYIVGYDFKIFCVDKDILYTLFAVLQITSCFSSEFCMLS